MNGAVLLLEVDDSSLEDTLETLESLATVGVSIKAGFAWDDIGQASYLPPKEASETLHMQLSLVKVMEDPQGALMEALTEGPKL